MAAMPSELEHKAREAFINDGFALAVALYTQAIAGGSPSAALHADRAQAYIKAAAADLARAAELDPAMSRAHACVELGQYGAALVPGDARFAELMKEIDDKAPKPMIPEPVMAMEADKPRYRHDYYNSAAEVAVTVFAKGVAPEHVSVEFGEQTLSVSIEGAYQLQPRLFGKIVPDKCRFTVLQTKVEVRLAKAEPGTSWTSLEFTGKPRLIATKANGYSAGAQRPSYPSSSRGGKDWDKIVAEVKEEEKLDGDAAANRFFRDIFGQADEGRAARHDQVVVGVQRHRAVDELEGGGRQDHRAQRAQKAWRRPASGSTDQAVAGRFMRSSCILFKVLDAHSIFAT
jgi:suppressor of G2 allele of SKP1